MSKGISIQRLPQRINARKMAFQNARFEGVIDVVKLPTLLEAAYAEDADVQVSIGFALDEDGRIVVDGAASVRLAFDCQRCMEKTERRLIEAKIHVAIVVDEQAAKQLPRSLDPWIADVDELDLFRCVEEELLLNLPVVAYHEAQCVDVELYSCGDNGNGDDSDTAPSPSPFAALAQLKFDNANRGDDNEPSSEKNSDKGA